MAGNPNPSLKDYLFAWGHKSLQEAEDDGYNLAQVGHHNYVDWRKPVTDDPWPFTPANCGFSDYTQGEWTRDGTRLVCLGCGLDST